VSYRPNRNTINFLYSIKSIIELIFLKFHQFILKIKKTSFKHNFNISFATYSPWDEDIEFQRIYKKIKKKTTIDIYRCYEIWSLLSQVKHLEGDLIEIGTYKGGSAALIIKQINDNINKYAKSQKETVYVCDTFFGVVKSSKDHDNHYSNFEHNDTSFEHVDNFLKNLNLVNYKILKGIFPDETGSFIENKKIKFCHIDVDTYQSAKDITEFLWSKLVSKGIIVFDDYGFVGSEGVTKFVNEFVEINRDLLFLHNLNGHGIIIKN